MSQAAQEVSSPISPDRKPFEFHSWLELPFFVRVDVDERYNKVSYREDRSTTLRIRIDSKAYRVSTGSNWLWTQDVQRWAQRIQAGEHPPYPALRWTIEYASEDQVQDLEARLRDQQGTCGYVHVEEIPAVVHLSAPVPDNLVPDQDFVPYEIRPDNDFLLGQVFPKLQTILDAYRVAELPFMRYSISPLSEALVDTAISRFTTRDGENIGPFMDYGFDVRSSRYLVPMRPTVQARFDRLLLEPSTWRDEDHFASSYYLYRMRRWNEAMVIASSAVDRLLTKVIQQFAPNEQAAEQCKRRGWKDKFNKTLPGFGALKLADENQALWVDFCQAKEVRGGAAHGNHPDSFDRTLAEDVGRHLRAFYKVAQWLCRQLGDTWALDVCDGDERLDPFP